MEQQEKKLLAAKASLDYIPHGSVLGVGTGSTVNELIDLLPSIAYPRLTVLTVYEDIPAEDLERLVTQRLEEVITSQTGVRGVGSRTREGVSIITVEYEWGTQMDFANLHLREAVDRRRRDGLPGWEIAEAENVLGACLASLDRLDEARRLLEQSTRILEQADGPTQEMVEAAQQRLHDFQAAR